MLYATARATYFSRSLSIMMVVDIFVANKCVCAGLHICSAMSAQSKKKSQISLYPHHCNTHTKARACTILAMPQPRNELVPPQLLTVLQIRAQKI